MNGLLGSRLIKPHNNSQAALNSYSLPENICSGFQDMPHGMPSISGDMQAKRKTDLGPGCSQVSYITVHSCILVHLCSAPCCRASSSFFSSYIFGKMSNVTVVDPLNPDWLNKGDNAWQLTAASLVALQSVPGLVVLYAGWAKHK